MASILLRSCRGRAPARLPQPRAAAPRGKGEAQLAARPRHPTTGPGGDWIREEGGRGPGTPGASRDAAAEGHCRDGPACVSPPSARAQSLSSLPRCPRVHCPFPIAVFLPPRLSPQAPSMPDSRLPSCPAVPRPPSLHDRRPPPFSTVPCVCPSSRIRALQGQPSPHAGLSLCLLLSFVTPSSALPLCLAASGTAMSGPARTRQWRCDLTRPGRPRSLLLTERVWENATGRRQPWYCPPVRSSAVEYGRLGEGRRESETGLTDPGSLYLGWG